MKEELRGLAELAEETGVPARTVRFYIARGLLPGPRVAGRAAVYGPEHLEALRAVRRLQERGLTLAEIAREMGGARGSGIGTPEPWWTYRLAEDVSVSVRADASPWRLKQIRAALEEMGQRLGKEKQDVRD